MLIPNDFDAQKEIQNEVLPNEKLLWSGKPKTGFLFRPADAFMIPFSLLWFGFAIFWESTAVSGGAPFFFALWGIPFICMGFYISIGRFFYDKKNRTNTVYGITGNRIIIKSGVFKKTIESFNIRTLSNLSINEKSDGTGTIKLDSDNAFSAFSIPGWPANRNAKPAPALEFIEQARSVYNLILQHQQQ